MKSDYFMSCFINLGKSTRGVVIVKQKEIDIAR